MTGDQPSGGDTDGPSEWDTDWTSVWTDDLADDEELFTAADEAQLAELTALLSAVPVPSIPGAVADRISAAISEEAANRAAAGTETLAPATGAATPATGALGARSLGKPLTRLGLPRRGGSGVRRRFQNRPLTAVGALTVCLVLSGVGYGISSVTSSMNSTVAGGSSSAEAGGAAGSVPGSAPRASGTGSVPAPGPSAVSGVPLTPNSPAASAATGAGKTGTANTPTTGTTPTKSTSNSAPNASSSSAVASTPPPVLPSASVRSTTPAATSAPSATSTGIAPAVATYVVESSGTNYLTASFASQVEARIAKPLAGSSPSAGVRSCVQRVIGSTTPALVDQATFQGTPVYVIATSTEAFAIAATCSSTGVDTSLDTVSLPG